MSTVHDHETEIFLMCHSGKKLMHDPGKVEFVTATLP